MKRSENIILCSCCTIEHQIVFKVIDGEVYAYIHLNNYRNFWKRLWVGIKYAFGYKSKTGYWDEFMLDENHIEGLEKIIEHLKVEK